MPKKKKPIKARGEIVYKINTDAGSEDKFKALYNHISDAAFLNKLDSDGRPGHFLELNDSAYKLYKISRKPGKQIYFSDLLADKSAAEKIGAEIAAVLRKSDHYSFNTVNMDTKGRTFPVEVNIRKFYMDGQTMFLSTARDITERKKMEDALAGSERYFRSLIEESNDIIAVLNQTGTIRYVSPAVERITGYAPAELENKHVLMLIPKLIMDNIGSGFKANLDSPGSSGTQEFRLKHRNGSMVILEVRWQNISGHGPLDGVVINARDITEKKMTEDNLKKIIWTLENSNAELEQFAHVSSHDLKEPLRMISCYIDLLEMRLREKSDAEIMEYMGYIKGGAKRMFELIQGLLTYSRVGKRKEDIKKVDLNPVVAQIAANFKVDAGPECFTIDTLPSITANPMEISQLFQNLISNSIKFRVKERPLSIKIKCEEHKQFFKFSVCDNGIGVEEEYREKIFELFERLHSDEEYAGTGIGLTICRKIVRTMGGKIWIESIPGQGTCVFFSIPITEVQDGR